MHVSVFVCMHDSNEMKNADVETTHELMWVFFFMPFITHKHMRTHARTHAHTRTHTHAHAHAYSHSTHASVPVSVFVGVCMHESDEWKECRRGDNSQTHVFFKSFITHKRKQTHTHIRARAHARTQAHTHISVCPCVCVRVCVCTRTMKWNECRRGDNSRTHVSFMSFFFFFFFAFPS